MHEMSIAQSIAECAMQQLPADVRLKRISLEVGAFSGVVPESLEFIWPMVSQHILGHECELKMFTVPLKIRCHACCHIQNANDIIQICERCESVDVSVLEGMDIKIIKLEMQ